MHYIEIKIKLYSRYGKENDSIDIKVNGDGHKHRGDIEANATKEH